MVCGLVSFGSHSVHMSGSIELSSLSGFQDCIASVFFCVFFFVRLPDLEKLLSYISSLIRNLGSGYTFENGFTVQNAYTLFYYRKECGTVSQKSKSLRREKMILTIFFSHNFP